MVYLVHSRCSGVSYVVHKMLLLQGQFALQHLQYTADVTRHLPCAVPFLQSACEGSPVWRLCSARHLSDRSSGCAAVLLA
jgi:kynurenine formamidase